MSYFIGKILELPVITVQDYTLFHILVGLTTPSQKSAGQTSAAVDRARI
jgi:hypothetical protein